MIEKDVRSGVINYIESLKSYQHQDTVSHNMSVNESLSFLENINFEELQNIIDKSLNNQVKYERF